MSVTPGASTTDTIVDSLTMTLTLGLAADVLLLATVSVPFSPLNIAEAAELPFVVTALRKSKLIINNNIHE